MTKEKFSNLAEELKAQFDFDITQEELDAEERAICYAEAYEPPQAEPAPNVKLMYNGIKVDGQLHKAYIYRVFDNTRTDNLPTGTIYYIAKNYNRLPQLPGTVHKNDTDSMTDYFDDDKIYILPDSPYFTAASQAYLQKEKIDAKRRMKFEAKRAGK